MAVASSGSFLEYACDFFHRKLQDSQLVGDGFGTFPERSCDCSERVAYACAGGDGICNDRDAETPVYAFGK